MIYHLLDWLVFYWISENHLLKKHFGITKLLSNFTSCYHFRIQHVNLALKYINLYHVNQIKHIAAGSLNNEWKSVGSGVGLGRYGDSSSWLSGATHGSRLGGTGSKATSYVNIFSYNKASAPDTSSDGWSGVNYGGRSYGSSNDWKSGKPVTEISQFLCN